MTDTLFRFDDISGGYGSTIVVDGVSGAVEPGKVLCVLGRNGVGKSTLMRLLSGHLACRTGAVRFKDEIITSLAPYDRLRRGISYCPQERPVFDNLSVIDNLCLMRPDRSINQFEAYFDAFPILKSRLRQQAGTLSGGERKILSFVRGLAEPNQLLLLDEPSEGVQQENIERMERFIDTAKANGRGFLIVEQHLAFAESVANAIMVIDQGRVVLSGKANEISHAQMLEHLHV